MTPGSVAVQPLGSVPDLWGLGWYADGGGERAPYPASRHEIAAHRGHATVILRELGVIEDDIVVFVARTREAVFYAPWEEACNDLGAAVCVVDGYSTEAHRLAAYVRMFSPRAVLGVLDVIVDGLLALGESPAELLSAVPVVAARPRARRQLAALGVPALPWHHLGPALAASCGRVDSAHLEPRWGAVIESAQVVLHPDEVEALGTGAIETGWMGELHSEPCGCGTVGPRVTLSGHVLSSGDELPPD
jgi:hypothetical protein